MKADDVHTAETGSKLNFLDDEYGLAGVKKIQILL